MALCGTVQNCPEQSDLLMHTLVARLKWCTPHEMLKGEMPNIDHLHVFGCGAFVYLPAMARANKMAPKSELMTYIGVAPGDECNFLFMCSTNTVFTAAHAVFDEHHFPCCSKSRHEPLENPLGGVILNHWLVNQEIPLMTLMAMMMWIMTMATHVTKHRMMIQSMRNHRLLRKSLIN